MSDVVIRVEGLGKRYQLGSSADASPRRCARRSRWPRPRSRVPPGACRTRRPVARGATELWALRDVSFEVAQGEVVGIIGRNGAGKSTLLKILSRITEPTEGRAELRGRVGSLLEVGTGFHPELTGRENIYLNGAILGMRRAEIDRKFDEIVAFAEVERFLDTPVKRYSSGMYVRLAFAVAAHLEPEILLVDEVLAVGDAAFQRKCLGKMSEVAPRRAHGALRQPQHGRGAAASARGRSSSTAARSRSTRRARKRLTGTWGASGTRPGRTGASRWMARRAAARGRSVSWRPATGAETRPPATTDILVARSSSCSHSPPMHRAGSRASP